MYTYIYCDNFITYMQIAVKMILPWFGKCLCIKTIFESKICLKYYVVKSVRIIKLRILKTGGYIERCLKGSESWRPHVHVSCMQSCLV